VFVLAFLASRQVKVWSNTESLWTQVIDNYPDLELARKARGKYYYLQYSQSTNSSERQKFENSALADFDIAMKKGTKDAAVYDAAGVILENRNDMNRALMCLNKALSIEPANGGFLYNRAMIFDRLGRKEESIADYTKALGLDPAISLKILSNRAVLLTETGKYAEAEMDLSRLISADSSNYMYYYNRAYTRLKQNKVYDAVEDYRAVLKLHPGDEQASGALREIARGLSRQQL